MKEEITNKIHRALEDSIGRTLEAFRTRFREALLIEDETPSLDLFTDARHDAAQLAVRTAMQAIPMFVDPEFEALEAEYVAVYNSIEMVLTRTGVPAGDDGGPFDLEARVRLLAQRSPINIYNAEESRAEIERLLARVVQLEDENETLTGEVADLESQLDDAQADPIAEVA